LTTSQLKELQNSFDDIDTDHSGYISPRELRKAYRYLGIRCSDDEIDIIMNQMDTNNDGKVSFEEYARVMARNYYKKHSKSALREAFR
jgi:Ca2+-binding EF-hand superfamily protein